MVRMRCRMGVSDALTLWKWRISFVVEWTLLLENRMDISLHRECCLLDCDLLWCWINRWIRLWKEMIGWFCFIILISSNNLSVEEESCESANPWIRDLISFVVISIILSTGDMEWPSWLLLFLPSHQKAIPIQSIFSNPSTELIHHSITTSIESTYLETGFLSIYHAVIHFDS